MNWSWQCGRLEFASADGGELPRRHCQRTERALWLQMKLAISFEQKNYKGCADALVQLIGLVPAKPDYWKQLSSMFCELKLDAESVAVLGQQQQQAPAEKAAT